MKWRCKLGISLTTICRFVSLQLIQNNNIQNPVKLKSLNDKVINNYFVQEMYV